MTEQHFDTATLRIASPCHMSWDSMSGDERVRSCDSCKLSVFNISELTTKEVAKLVRNHEGRLCMRMYRRADGTVITKNCPVGLRAIQRRVGRLAAATFATVLSLFSASYGQKSDKDWIDAADLKIEKSSIDSQNSVLTGTIADRAGAVIPGATVTLSANDGTAIVEKSNKEGIFTFPAIPNGEFDVKITSPGFAVSKIRNLQIANRQKLTMNIILDIGPLMGETVTVTEPPPAETVQSQIQEFSVLGRKALPLLPRRP